jgi:peptide deformylase
VLFNPRIIATGGPERTEDEANLSLPGIRAAVTRPHTATIEWQTIDGDTQTATFEGWQARVLMHEIEILDGQLFIDHAAATPIGNWTDEEDRARRTTSALYGEPAPPRLIGSDALGLATVSPSLRGLDGTLTRPAQDIDLDALDARHLRTLIQGMLRVQYERRGVGLAAPQVGLALRLVVVDTGDRNPLVFINPEIVDRDEREEAASEGCLSIPGWRGEVRRSVAIKVATDTLDGERTELDFSGYLARVAQHEIDHLDGILFTERMAPSDKLEVTDPDAIADGLLNILAQRDTHASRPPDRPPAARKGANRRRSKRRR